MKTTAVMIAQGIGALLCTLVFVSGTYNHLPLTQVLAIVAFVVVLAIGRVLAGFTTARGYREFKAVTAGDFIADRISWYDASGLAADVMKGTLVLADEDRVVAIPFTDLGSSRFVEHREPGKARGAGYAGLVSAAFVMAEAVHDYDQAGLFVETGSVASFHIKGVSRSEGEQWLQFLTDIKAGTAQPSRLARMAPIYDQPI